MSICMYNVTYVRVFIYITMRSRCTNSHSIRMYFEGADAVAISRVAQMPEIPASHRTGGSVGRGARAEPARPVPSVPHRHAVFSATLFISVSPHSKGRAKLTLIQCAQTRVCMPPGPVYNWLAVAHSALMILDRALQYRAAQVTRVESIRVSQSWQRGARAGVHEKTREEVKDVEVIVRSTADEPRSSGPTCVQSSSLLHANEAWLRQLEITATPRTSLFETVSEPQLRGDTTVASRLLEPSSSSTTVPGIAETRPHAAEPPMPAADVNLSRSAAPVDDVLSHQPSQSPVYSEICSTIEVYARD